MSSKKVSSVWNHFEKTTSGATCSLCRVELKHGGSTGILWKHLKVHQKQINPRTNPIQCDNQEMDETSETDETDDPTSVEATSVSDFAKANENTSDSSVLVNKETNQLSLRTQPKITSHFLNKTETSRKSEKITNLISSMIAEDMLPLSFVENSGFRKLMKYLVPSYSVPSNTTIKRRLCLKYEHSKNKIKQILQKTTYVSLTTDTWSSRSTKSFITVTAHFISEDWKLESVVLATEEMPERHTSENLTSRLNDIISKWEIGNKISGIVHDNASNITGSIAANREAFGESVNCFAHSLQLCINNSLKASEMTGYIITKCSDIVGFFKHSNIACHALKTRQTQLNLPVHKLIQKNATRWNSTYYMFQRLLEQKQAILAVLADRDIVKSKVAANLQLSELEWISIEKMVALLEPFEKATNFVSGEKYITLSMVKPLIKSIKDNFLNKGEEYCECSGLFIERVTEEINTRFLFNEREKNLTLYDTTALLDPRFKNTIPEDLKSLGIQYLKLLVSKVQTDEPDPSDVNMNISTLSYLFPKIPKKENTCEVTSYFSLEVSGIDISPLKWWQSHQEQFPKLSLIARRFLCIPATSTPSERVFSTAGNIVTAKRSCLSSENVNLLIFLYENINSIHV